MSAARPEEVPSLRPHVPTPPDPPPLLARLWHGALPVLLLAALGGITAFALAHLRRPWYRATTTLLVGEPAMSGGPSLFDFNLTSVRSFTGLLTSQSACEACAALAGEATAPDLLARRVKVRVPENTRLLEVSFEAADPKAAAAFTNCLAGKAVEESARISAGLAAQGTRTVDSALETLRAETTRLQGELADARGRSLLELKRAELRAALAALEKSAEEERRAAIDAAGAGARRGSLEVAGKARPERRRLSSYLSRDPEVGAAAPGTGGTPVVREEADPTRDLAERGAAEAAAAEAAARASADAAARSRSAAERKAAALEKEIARAEQELDTLGKRVASASSGQAELEKRRSLLPVEAAARALLLVPLAPALPPARPSNAAPWLVGLVGAAAAGTLGALLVLSREER